MRYDIVRIITQSVSFDEIAPFLSKSYTEGTPLAPFKMHYDYLRHLVPQQNEHNDKIIVYLIPPAVDCPRITITAFLEPPPLEESLGREVVVEDNADIPLAETHILQPIRCHKIRCSKTASL